MNVDEFLSTMDALRFDDSLDETYPELRGLVRKVYPYIRQIYNIMSESGMLTESHGQKKHNPPKDALCAMRKGNREGEMEIYGDGFKANKKIHRTGKKDKLDKKKINVNNYHEFVGESINNKVKITESSLNALIANAIRKNLKEQQDLMQYEDDDMILDTSPKDDFGKYAPGMEVNWGENIENMIKTLSSYFSEFFAPEEDEFGFKQNAFDDLINHLKYYYEINRFNERAFNAIYQLLDNYDLTSDEEVKHILLALKNYC